MKKDKTHLLFIVEDHEAYSFMLKYELERNLKYKILIFRSIEDCLASIELSPDLIILDCNLPGINDLKVLRNLKTQSFKIPMVILTRSEDTAVFHEFIRDGTFDSLLKETQTSQLADKLLLKIESTLRSREIQDRRIERRQMALWVISFFICIAGVLGFILL
jgi:DNA-binding NtrC family response regulator